MKLAFFIGSVDISGGTYVIYQHALYARDAGHDVTIVVQYPYESHQFRWHPACNQLKFVPVDEVGGLHFDLVVATWWKTASELHGVSADRYAYFVQSIESRFYPDEEGPLRGLVDRTYDLGLPTITEAAWIQDDLRARNGTVAQLVRNGIRKDLYTPDGNVIATRPPRGKLRVLVEGPMGVFFKNVGRSLKLSRESTADSTWLLTSTLMQRMWGVDRTFSRVPITEVPAIYRSCDVLLKLSYVEGMFGPPLEMFHSGGTAVVYDVTGHDEYIKQGENAIVVPRDDEQGVVAALNKLRAEPDLLDSLKAGAAATSAAWPNWDDSSAAFLEALGRIGSSPSRDTLRQRNADSMAEYVELEQTRLATMDNVAKPITLFEKVAARSRHVAHLRRQWGFYQETR